MRYKIKNRTISIPDADINAFIKNHNITKDEAIKMWLEDEGYLENSEVEQLTKSAKENKIKHEASATEKKTTKSKPRTVKISEEKQYLFNKVLNSLNDLNPIVLRENKLINITLNNKTFKIDIIEQRK